MKQKQRNREKRVAQIALKKLSGEYNPPRVIRGYNPVSRSKYKPHQGWQECARRKQQLS